jgi:4-carboxymuconolactone decarboxylase
MGGQLLLSGSLPAREREIVVLRMAWRASSEYEFGQHRVVGVKAGLTDAEVVRLMAQGAAGWPAGDAALVAMTDELYDDDMVSDPTWEQLARRWTPSELLELLVLAGFYRMVAGMLNSAGVPLEAAAPGWADDARPRLQAPRDPGS